MQQETEQKVSAYKIGLGHMQEHQSDVVQAFHAFTGECFKEGRLDAKQKQLIAIGISLFANNEVCTFYHVSEALEQGADAEEIMDTVAVAAAIGGGHVMSQGATRVQQALDRSRAH
ncbi:carboxymuconolactone decarboxylase family protein [Xylanibacillus composti]|uniref:Carboxymuconolactone decarboxylase-like domain-containing protein n=1 Tax=Xylanibacillus composti TaxID=1572762 RepID=A0A8J4GZ64_9BACL|nr:carboxymuconolactone decarboxylase family protein [Xylanibacillus composti]MDT9723978.1 carboxymuconolactone decarboxylase family protein [Xylanibacillus composti]GIQ67859.1 hypothetical protein XYCOK13_06830 [Xylanibacillus composti]